MAKKNKTKFIFECTGPSELTQFNKEYNKGIEAHCERSHTFVPDLTCCAHTEDMGACKYLKIHTYKGAK